MAKEQMPRIAGSMLGLYSDLGSGYLTPERARIEAMEFRCRVDPNGSIAFDSPDVTMLADYAFAVRKIVGFALNEDTIQNAAALITFNVAEQGRGSPVFKRPISFAAALKGALEWDGAYVFYPGTTISVDWNVDTARWPSYVNNLREVGIVLVGELVLQRQNING